MGKQTPLATPASTQEDDSTTTAASAVTDENLDSSQDEPEQSMLEAMEEAIGGTTEGETVGDKVDEPEAEEEQPAEAEGDDGDEPEEPEAEDGDTPEAEAKANEGEDSSEEDDDGSDIEKGQTVPYDRFRQVIKQKNKFRSERDELVSERDTYKEGHDRFQAIAQFRERNNLQDQDVVRALQISALINNNPQGALQALSPIVDQLRKAVGEILPEDLQSQVDNGAIDENVAKETARLRNEHGRLQQEQQRTREQQEQREAEARQAGLRQSMATAASNREQELRAKDPDFESKLPLISGELSRLMREKPAQTPEQAAALVEEAYGNVRNHLAKLTRKPAVKPGPSSNGQGSRTTQTAEPKSMLDAMLQSIESAN